MPKMKAAIFAEPGRIVLESRPVPDVGPLDALVRISTTTICGTDVHILRGEYPVATGPDRRPRAGRHHREAGLPGRRVPGRPARHRRRHHAERPQLCLPVRAAFARRRNGATRLQAGRWLALRQHDRRMPGGVRAGARRHGQSRPGAVQPDGRTGADVPRHHVDRASPARKAAACGSATSWRCSRWVRSAFAPQSAPG